MFETLHLIEQSQLILAFLAGVLVTVLAIAAVNFLLRHFKAVVLICCIVIVLAMVL